MYSPPILVAHTSKAYFLLLSHVQQRSGESSACSSQSGIQPKSVSSICEFPKHCSARKSETMGWLPKLLISLAEGSHMEILNFKRPWNSVPPRAQEQLEFLDGEQRLFRAQKCNWGSG